MKTCFVRSQLPGILGTFLILSLYGCGTVSKPIPKWDGKIWAADSSRSSIRRSQESEEIKANDPLFDSYMAMTYQDFRSFYATYILGCEKWRDGIQMMDATEALQRYSIAMKDLQDAEKVELEKKAAIQ